MKKLIVLKLVFVLVIGGLVYGAVRLGIHLTSEIGQDDISLEFAGVDPSDYLDLTEQIHAVDLVQLTSDEKRELYRIYDQERAARDLFMSFDNAWGLDIFSNLAASEESHYQTVKVLLDKYALFDLKWDTFEVYQTQAVQSRYDAWKTEGLQSLAHSLQIGGMIEEQAIQDYQELSDQIDKIDILFVLANLMKGSRNHLRLLSEFMNELAIDYTVTYLTQSEFDQIVNLPRETDTVPLRDCPCAY